MYYLELQDFFFFWSEFTTPAGNFNILDKYPFHSLQQNQDSSQNKLVVN